MITTILKKVILTQDKQRSFDIRMKNKILKIGSHFQHQISKGDRYKWVKLQLILSY